LWAVYWDASKALEPNLKKGQPATKFLFKGDYKKFIIR